jgi:hypothetical protein
MQATRVSAPSIPRARQRSSHESQMVRGDDGQAARTHRRGPCRCNRPAPGPRGRPRAIEPQTRLRAAQRRRAAVGRIPPCPPRAPPAWAVAGWRRSHRWRSGRPASAGYPRTRHKSNPRGRLESRQRRIAPRESETGTYPPSAILPALLRRDVLVQEPRGAHIAGGDTRASLRERRHRWMDSVSSRRTGRTAAAGVRAPASGAQGE